MMMMMCNDLDV